MSGPVWSVSSTDILISGFLFWSSLLVLLAWLKGKQRGCVWKMNDNFVAVGSTCTYSTRCGAGMEVTHKIRALQTPLHDVTVGSGYRLNTHTWPTYPSLLHTHTSLWFNAGAAHVNWSPARVFRMGTGPTKSAFGLRSVDNTTNRGDIRQTIKFVSGRSPRTFGTHRAFVWPR